MCVCVSCQEAILVCSVHILCVCRHTQGRLCVSLDGSSRPEHSRKVFVWPTLKTSPTQRAQCATQIKSCFSCRSEISWRHIQRFNNTASGRSIYTVMQQDTMSQTEPRTFLINSCRINARNNIESSLSCCLVLSVRHTDTCSKCQTLRSVLMTQIRLNILFTTQSQTTSNISRPFISVQSHMKKQNKKNTVPSTWLSVVYCIWIA